MISCTPVQCSRTYPPITLLPPPILTNLIPYSHPLSPMFIPFSSDLFSLISIACMGMG